MISGDMTPAKIKHQLKLTEFLINPENEWPGRSRYHKELGITQQAFYQFFSPADLAEIEREALTERRKHYCSSLSMIDKALMAKASEGDVAAIKLALQVYDSYREETVLQHGVDTGTMDKTEIAVKLSSILAAAKARQVNNAEPEQIEGPPPDEIK